MSAPPPPMEAPPVPPAYPMAPPAPVYLRPTTPGGALASDRMVRVVVVLFGLLLLVAALVLQARVFLDPRNYSTAEEFSNAYRSMSFTGLALVDVAMFLLLVFALLVGTQRTDLSDSTRKAFMAFALIVFFFWWITVLSQSQLLTLPFLP